MGPPPERKAQMMGGTICANDGWYHLRYACTICALGGTICAARFHSWPTATNQLKTSHLVIRPAEHTIPWTFRRFPVAVVPSENGYKMTFEETFLPSIFL